MEEDKGNGGAIRHARTGAGLECAAKTCPRLRPGIAYTVIQRATVPGDFAHAVRRCEIRVGKRAAMCAFRSTPERARLPTLRRHAPGQELRLGVMDRQTLRSFKVRDCPSVAK
jgi:hypothetical protein